MSPSAAMNSILHGDCVERMAAMDAGSVDLAFADPPFNIGYDYDVYHDNKAAHDYLDWSRSWIAAVHRILKTSGTFWLAIGDEYAAELKIASQEIGFFSRSWVIWYYTFGVNCKNKFSRSHAHLFYFVKDPDRSIHLPRRRPGEPHPFGPATWSMPTAGRIPRAGCPTTPGCCGRKTWPIASPRPKTPGTFPAWPARSRSGPASTAARCPSNCWAGSSASARIQATWCSIPSAAAPRRWRWRKNSAATISASTCRKNTSSAAANALASIAVGDPLDGSPEPNVSAPSTPPEPRVRRRRSSYKTDSATSARTQTDRTPSQCASVDPKLF